MGYAKLLNEYIKKSELSLGEIARRVNEKGVKIDKSYISKIRNGDANPPSDEITFALAEVTGGDPERLIWAGLIDKSHPSIKRDLMMVDKIILGKAIELKKKYPIPDGLSDEEVDDFIDNIPEYSELFDLLFERLNNNESPQNNYLFKETQLKTNYDEDVKEKMLKRSNEMVQQFISRTKRKNENEDYINPEFVQIPIYGEIRAGYNSIADQKVIGYEMISKQVVSDGEYFYLMVKGDSMIDEGIREGMRVLVKSQNHCEHGKIGVVIVNGDEGTLKRVYYEKDTVILQAANRDIPPRILPINEVRIQGQVKKVEFDV